MTSSTAQVIKWYTPERARLQKISGIVVFLGTLVVMLVTQQPDIARLMYVALFLCIIGEYGAAIAELKERAGVREVSPFMDVRTVVVLAVVVVLMILFHVLADGYVFG